jgi:HSP20 family protein
MAIERWRPFEEIREMERMMDEMMRWPFRPWRRPLIWWRIPTEEVGWSPPVEMYEKQDKFIVRVELPGMKKDDVDISLVGDTLTISGERKPEEGIKDEEYLRCELCYGKFSRSITLPSAVDIGKVEATYENGILLISLPKAEEAKPKKIELKVNEAKK